MTRASGRLRVLLVDDEPSILKVVGRRLESAGYEVVTAADGQDGLTKVRVGRPDIVLLDLMLPKLSGLEVCAALKSDASLKHIPVIMFTSHGKLEDIFKSSTNVVGFITKPFNVTDLMNKISSVIVSKNL